MSITINPLPSCLTSAHAHRRSNTRDCGSRLSWHKHARVANKNKKETLLCCSCFRIDMKGSRRRLAFLGAVSGQQGRAAGPGLFTACCTSCRPMCATTQPPSCYASAHDAGGQNRHGRIYSKLSLSDIRSCCPATSPPGHIHRRQ